MHIQEFAEKYDVKTQKDSCGETLIPGKQSLTLRVQGHKVERVEYRSHIFDGYGSGRLGLCLMFETPLRWTWAKKKLLAAGFLLRQDGDTEGIATFDPANEAQARLALRTARIKARRHPKITEAQKQAFIDRTVAARAKAA